MNFSPAIYRIYYSFLYWGACMVMALCTKAYAQHSLSPVHNFNIPDSNIFSLEDEIRSGSIGTFLNNEQLFVARGTNINIKGRLFNLIGSNPSASSFFLADEEGRRTKYIFELDAKHNFNLTNLQSNHNGTAILGTDDKGYVIYWLRKLSQPSEKKRDFIYKIVDKVKLLNKPIQELRIAVDDEHLSVLGKESKELLLWHQSFKTKPGKFGHHRMIFSSDFNPMSPEKFAVADSLGKIYFVAPRYPAAYTKEFFVEDSLSLPNPEPIVRLRYTPYGQHIIALTAQQNMYIYDVARRRPYLYLPHIHDSSITNLQFLKEANYFITGSMDSSAKIWSMELRRCIFNIKRSNPITDLSTSTRDNFFLLFDNKDSAYQYYFNDYILNSLFLLHNVSTEVQLDFKKWEHQRSKANTKNFLNYSRKSYLQNRLFNLIKENINKYAVMSFYKNMVTLKTESYDAEHKLLSCTMDGFKETFKIKIDARDTNFFKSKIRENVQVSDLEARISDDGGIILEKGKITTQDKHFNIVPNKGLTEQEEPLTIAFSVDTTLAIYLSSLDKWKVDSLRTAPLLFKSDVDTFTLSRHRKMFSKKSKAAFIGIGISAYKDKKIDNYFAERDLKSVSSFFASLLGIPKKNTLRYKNIDAAKFNKAFSANESSTGDLALFIKKAKPTELYIYCAVKTGYSPRTNKDYIMTKEGIKNSPEQNGIPWEDFLLYIDQLPVKKINLLIDSDIKNRDIFLGLSSKTNTLLLNKSSQKNKSNKMLFHNLFTYVFLKTIHEREHADYNQNHSLTFQEMASYMQDQIRRLSKKDKTSMIELYGLDKNRIFFTYKSQPPPAPSSPTPDPSASSSSAASSQETGKNTKPKKSSNAAPTKSPT